MGRRKKYRRKPAQIRYDQKHPAVTVRFTVDEYKIIEAMQKRRGCSKAQLFKEAFKLIKKDYDAYKKGYNNGYKEGYENGGSFIVPCSKCGEDMVFHLHDDVDIGTEAIDALVDKFIDWHHIECQRKRRTKR
jgi:hypothetical protein